VIAIESADPRWLAASSEGLCDVAHRVRAMGSIAISMCQVAPTRVDGMATLWKSRAVDCAAAQLIVREAGGLVRFVGCEEPLGAPLDLVPRAPVVAARTPAALEQLAGLPRT
jgi:myo-inositol-1(or 4)-monophosphatase